MGYLGGAILLSELQETMRPARAFPKGAFQQLSKALKQAKTKGEFQRVQCLWLQAQYLKEGEQVLQAVGRGGRRNQNLTVEQERQLLTGFSTQAQEAGMLEVSQIKQAYEEAIGHPVPKSTVYRMLARHGWRKIAPRRRHPQARTVRLMFQDEAALDGSTRRDVAGPRKVCDPKFQSRIVREYSYLFGATSPHDGVLDTLILPEVNAEAMSLFLAEVAERHSQDYILMVLDGAGWHRARELIVPLNCAWCSCLLTVLSSTRWNMFGKKYERNGFLI